MGRTQGPPGGLPYTSAVSCSAMTWRSICCAPRVRRLGLWVVDRVGVGICLQLDVMFSLFCVVWCAFILGIGEPRRGITMEFSVFMWCYMLRLWFHVFFYMCKPPCLLGSGVPITMVIHIYFFCIARRFMIGISLLAFFFRMMFVFNPVVLNLVYDHCHFLVAVEKNMDNGHVQRVNHQHVGNFLLLCWYCQRGSSFLIYHH